MSALVGEMNSFRLRFSTLCYGALEWGASNPKKILALHGWLDNAASFNYLGPMLADNGYHVVAVDHLGHGRSSHLPIEASYNYFTGVTTIDRVLSVLVAERGEEWKKPHALIGHSMSTGHGMLFASSCPDKVNKLVLLEALGPLTAKEEDAATKLGNSLGSESAWMERLGVDNCDTRPPKVYETIQKAIDTRMFVVGRYPGDQSISKEAATAIVCRGVSDARASLDELFGDGEDGGAELESDYSKPVKFRHDSRLLLPSPMYLSSRQVLGFAKDIKAPTLLIRGKKGWPPSNAEEMQERREAISDLTYHEVTGSHHCHLDPETARETGTKILEFLGRG